MNTHTNETHTEVEVSSGLAIYTRMYILCLPYQVLECYVGLLNLPGRDNTGSATQVM
jgi:hypothetical protein